MEKKVYFSASLLLAVTAAWTFHRLRSQRRMLRCKQEVINKSIIQKDIIIIAFQPENLFIRMKTTNQKHCKQLKNGGNGLMKNLMGLFFEKGVCYQETISGKSLRRLLKELKGFHNVKIMIYTKLQRQVLDEILENFGLSHYFQSKHKVHMQHQYKSADEVDHDTRRVVIVSGTKDDQRDCVMSNNHNLILNIGEQRLEGRICQKLRALLLKIVEIGRADSLHEEMHELAMELNLPLWNDYN